MTAEFIFYLILTILIAGFLIDMFLSYLNYRSSRQPIPQLLDGIYDNNKYLEQQAYMKANHRFGNVNSLFSLIVILLMLIFDGFSYADNLARTIGVSEVFTSLIFFALLAFANEILSIPFDVYDTFVIEKKFGFNKTSPKIYITDKIKSWLLMAIIGGGLITLITWVYYYAAEYFWVLTWVAIFLFSIVANFLYSDLIVPLFNKQKPLEEGELRTAISDFAAKAGFSLKKIMVIDGSKRSTKANAYFSGFGSRKRVVLYDTLIAEMQTDEIVAVLAHEIGHYKKKHVLINLIVSSVSTACVLYLLSLFLKFPEFSQAINIENASFHSGLLVFGILFTPISALAGIFTNMSSRRHEFSADKYATMQYHANSLISALKKLSSHNMVNLTPHPWFVFVNYSHPPLLHRIKRINEIEAKS